MTKMSKLPSFQRVRELLHYDPETGVFSWVKERRARNPYKGRCRAGSLRPNGYRAIRIDYQSIQEHRLAWFYVYGEWPAKHIDHANRDKADNRIANLRLASRSDNLANMIAHRDNSTGLKGVARHKRLGWVARICVNRKSHFLGYHPTPEAAHEAYKAAAVRLRGEFART